MQKNVDCMPDWLCHVILGNGNQELGEQIIRKLAIWVKMSRRKHDWSKEVQGNVNVIIDALKSELFELENAYLQRHPSEHCVSELLDLITVAIRFLSGEHLHPNYPNSASLEVWKLHIKQLLPTEPGEVSPYDEHKGNKRQKSHELHCERCGKELTLKESANGGLCDYCLFKAALEDDEKRPQVMYEQETFSDVLKRHHGNAQEAMDEIVHPDYGKNNNPKNKRDGKRILSDDEVEKILCALAGPGSKMSEDKTHVILGKNHKRGSILLDAFKTINGERQDMYGEPEDCFGLIAALWDDYLLGVAAVRQRKRNKAVHDGSTNLGKPQFVAQMDAKSRDNVVPNQSRTTLARPDAHDVAMMMALMKIARIVHGAGGGDSYLDAAGYIALAYDLMEL